MKKLFLFTFFVNFSSFSATLSNQLLKMRVLHFERETTAIIQEKCKKTQISPICLYQIEKNKLSEIVLNKYFHNKNADRDKIIKVLNEVFNIELSKEALNTCMNTIEIKSLPPTKLNNTQRFTDAFSKKRNFNTSEFNYLLNFYIKEHNDKIALLIQRLNESKQLNIFSSKLSGSIKDEVKKSLPTLKLSGI